jgi:hypothetical protein
VDLGIIHPYAVAGPDGQALLVSGRAIRADLDFDRMAVVQQPTCCG